MMKSLQIIQKIQSDKGDTLNNSSSSIRSFMEMLLSIDRSDPNKQQQFNFAVIKKISKIFSINFPPSIQIEQLTSQFKKMFLRMQFGHLVPGQLIQRDNQQPEICIILSGTADIQTPHYTFKRPESARTQKPVWRKRNNRISHLAEYLQDESPPIQQLATNTNIRAVTTGYFMKVPKKYYFNFVSWLHTYESECLVKFINKSLGIANDDIKIYKFHKKVLKIQVQIGKTMRINQNISNQQNKYKQLIVSGVNQIKAQQKLSDSNQIKCDKGLLILQKGQGKLFCKIDKKQHQIYITEKTLINNFYQTKSQNQPVIIYLKFQPTCDSNILLFPASFMNQLETNSKTNYDKIVSLIKKVEHNRYQFFFQQPVEQNQQKIYKPINFQIVRKRPKTSQSTQSRVCKKYHTEEFLPKQYEQFLSNFPFEKITESEQIVFNKKLQRAPNNKKFEKIANYIKQSQIKQKRKNKKIIELRMKNIAQKTFSHKNASQIHKRASKNLRTGLFDEGDDFKQNKALNTPTQKKRQSQERKMTLSKNDTGIIHEFVKNSYSYQKQLDYLLKCSELMNPKKKKTSNSIHSSTNSLFTHQIINKFIKKQPNRIQTEANQDTRSSNFICYNDFLLKGSKQNNQFLDYDQRISTASSSQIFRLSQSTLRTRNFLKRGSIGKFQNTKIGADLEI